MMTRRARAQGFALPSIIISSLVMFTVLVALIGNVSSTKVSLDGQFYKSLARDAAESGWSHVDSCLKSNGYLNTWAGSKLKPETNCSGVTVSGQAQYIVNNSKYRSYYEVTSTTNATTKAIDSEIVGKVELLRSAGGTPWKTYEHMNKVSSTRKVTNETVVFGYNSSPQTAFYSILGSDGILRSAGANTYGQLGDGTTNDVYQPTPFMAPAGTTIVAAFANFLSVGNLIFAVDNTGQVFAAGRNNGGKAGVGSTDANILIPQRVQMPIGEVVTSVTYGGAHSFFITASGNVYASGTCGSGILGTGTTCTPTTVPVRISLPTPNPADPNTMPTNNLVVDGGNAYLRMVGGRVYGWGGGYLGQLAQGSANRNTIMAPVQIGTYGDSGQPAATSIATDGGSVFILDNNGQMKSAGGNEYGQLGSNKSEVYNVLKNVCLTASSDLASLSLANCNGTGYQSWEYRADQTFYNQTTNRCMVVQADNVSLGLAACNTSNYQKFEFVYNRMYRNIQTAKCLNNTNGDAVSLEVNATCNISTFPSEQFAFSSSSLLPLSAPGMTGTVKKIATDQWSVSVLTTTGEVWSGGLNTGGQFGNGTQTLTQHLPVRFQLPTGVTAVDLVTTNAFTPAFYSMQNLYVIGSDGRVYGAGGNGSGQLGDGTTTTRPTPVAMEVIDGASVSAKSVQAGLGTAIIFTNDNRVFGVGNNRNGQLGNPAVTDSYSSIPVANKYVDQYIFNQY